MPTPSNGMTALEIIRLTMPEFEKVKGPWLFTSQRPFC